MTSSLARQARVERVLMFWRSGQRDTHSIAADVQITEREVCDIIEQAEGRRP
ncbi:hypothetical protein [Sinorhizobium meliloti]|uniref:hypothetical protein n=1 Tax=Rhizobium meliloti TaxID=382 RepID=UPI0001E4D7E8|nr:hypothetical protein [Sinorhizobium meliloti]AEG04260.1 hypothetical protein SinmeB_1339 [Sinorhizobium meliloti BL225C]MDE4545201.1 hypothetical protein [Sinorhizobium meliloti]MDE4573776.1 hypothetical protein [Sinorhizobium meliloti]SDY98845.1 hypothetical protein SAMN04244576_04583 [Sinorhizobium meliloti]